jgi:hypothetical protein
LGDSEKPAGTAVKNKQVDEILRLIKILLRKTKFSVNPIEMHIYRKTGILDMDFSGIIKKHHVLQCSIYVTIQRN